MPALLLVGDDKLSRTLAHRVEKAGINLPIYVDRSWGCSRVWAMVRRGVLSPLVVARMAWAELCRPAPPTGAWPAIRSNRELVAACRREEADRVYLFRVGLIIGPPVLEAGLEVFNLHCASLPRFGGLGALSRALAEGAWEQQATLHRVTREIDRGEIVATRSYRLDPRLSYRRNEDRAYEAGMELLLEVLAHCEGEASKKV